MKPNRLRQKLDAGETTVSTNIYTSSPDVVEMLGHAGTFDYVEFEAEYVPYDLHWMDHFARVTELFPHLSAMIKIDQEPRTFMAARAIGAGIQNVLFADVRTPEEARQCVAAMKPETPGSVGHQGYGDRRVSRYFLDGPDAYVKILENSVVALMIEKKSAVDNLEAILDVEGIDMVQFGAADFSLNIGKPGQWEDPEVTAAKNRVIRTSLKMGVHPKVGLHSPEDARRYLDMGVRHFILGGDLGILYSFWKEKGKQLQDIIAGH